MMTKDQVVDHMMRSRYEDLVETVYYSHKDQYGTKGHHLLKASKEELVSWWLSHYTWKYEDQRWETIVSFEVDVPSLDEWAEMEEEFEYHQQFG